MYIVNINIRISIQILTWNKDWDEQRCSCDVFQIGYIYEYNEDNHDG